jgi:putative oxidoreductase
MNWLTKMEVWGDRHHPKWLDLLRILLGCIILWKGYAYISNTAALQQIIEKSSFDQVSFLIAHYVAMVHLVGGVLIIVGLITRIACIFQIPILLGAVIFNAQTGIFSSSSSELWLSLIVLFLLIFFTVEGSGPWSIDEVMKREEKPDRWNEELDKAHIQH